MYEAATEERQSQDAPIINTDCHDNNKYKQKHSYDENEIT